MAMRQFKDNSASLQLGQLSISTPNVKGSQWIADLLRHGLLSASFIPPAPIRQLRNLTRYRKMLAQE